MKLGGCGEVVNTPDCGSGTRGFETLQSPHLIQYFLLGRSQVGKARDFDSRTRWFESSRPSHYHDPLAQSVEHLTFNQGVPRSSRGWITTCGSGGIGRRTRLRIWRFTAWGFKSLLPHHL